MAYLVQRQGGAVVATNRVFRLEGGEFPVGEVLPDDHPDIIAFRQRPQLKSGPITAEEIWTALETKGVVAPQDRPRPAVRQGP